MSICSASPAHSVDPDSLLLRHCSSGPIDYFTAALENSLAHQTARQRTLDDYVTPTVPAPTGETMWCRLIDRLTDYAAEWLSGVNPITSMSVTCPYTTTPDGNFVIDRVDRITVAAGFSGHGFTSTPAVGELVAGVVAGNIRAPELFSLRRGRISLVPARSA